MNSRKEELELFLRNCCCASAIVVDTIAGMCQSIKLIPNIGKIFYLTKNRMIDPVYVDIPNWDKEKDMAIITREIVDHRVVFMCESHKLHEDRSPLYYCYTLSWLIKD